VTAAHVHPPVQPVGTVLPPETLAALFADAPGARRPAEPNGNAELAEQIAITAYQWRQAVRHGLVRGFLLSGPPGTGKTTAGKRLAFELGLLFPRRPGRDGVATVLIDGSAIARSKYGESERRIRELFDEASLGFGTPGQRAVLIFDDVESVLMARGSAHAKEWHFSQDSVFFHCIDDLDTSRVVVVLTTNRPDLVDAAIRDRFLGYDVGYPSERALIEVVLHRLRDQGLSGPELTAVAADVESAVRAGGVRSFRDAEHLALRTFVAHTLGQRPDVGGGQQPAAI
jgi:SpoVK/Ycf46/Vps4 family AAA+-type ATPase